MKSRLFIIMVIVGCLFFSFSKKTAMSQEGYQDEERYLYGEVVDFSHGTLSINKITKKGQEEYVSQFEIVSGTEFLNFDSIDQLEEGDVVDIYYNKIGGKLIATVISKEIEEEEEEENFEIVEDSELDYDEAEGNKD